jgi:hypothetical protein
MSYFGNSGFRSSRSSMLTISCLVKAIPFSYVEVFNRIVGGRLFQVMLWAQASIVSTSVRQAPFQWCSRIPQHRTLREGKAYNRIVFTVIRRKVQQLQRFSDAVHPVHQAIEKLGSHPATFGAIINFELNRWQCLSGRGRQMFPPLFQHIDNEITRFVRSTEFNIEIPSVLIHEATGNALVLGTHVVVAGLDGAPGFAPRE